MPPRLGLITRNPESWCSAQLLKSMMKKGVDSVCFSLSDITAKVASIPFAITNTEIDILKELDAVLIRPIGRGSLEEIIFRLDVLRRLEKKGLLVINPPRSIEISADKYRSLSLMEEEGIPIPPTIATEDSEAALKAFQELGGDVVIKPIFGSRGMGIGRVTDPETAWRIFHTLSYTHHVLYIQKFIHHGTRDMRLFVVGDRVIAAMYREADSWKTNIDRGARPFPFEPSKELEELAVKVAKTIGCKVSGVDVMESEEGYVVNEINSQPGFKGLQLVTKVNIADEIVDHIVENIRR
ncbi:MAG: RimK family alpha-L-glutamate ligase [archaeon]|nr:RimK family alpha-L-glutamate ligase [archaeon]MCP8306291.1 RimK family alpha-L-glutamate ligase [archaeon]